MSPGTCCRHVSATSWWLTMEGVCQPNLILCIDRPLRSVQQWEALIRLAIQLIISCYLSIFIQTFNCLAAF